MGRSQLRARHSNSMKSSFLKDLTTRFCILAGVMALGITLVAQSLLMKQARSALEYRLSEKAVFINSFYAFLIADSLQRKDDVTLLQVINRLEQDQEITSVVVVDDKGEVRYHADAEKVGTLWDDPLMKKALETNDGIMMPFNNSGGRALALVSPLKVQGQSKPIGVVKIEMTYNHINKQLQGYQNSFEMTVLGLIGMSVGVMMVFVRRWIVYPMKMLEKWLGGMTVQTAEAALPETPDEFGQVNKAINDLILRFKGEFQNQGDRTMVQADREKQLVDQLMRKLLPDARVLVADKDNALITDTGNGALPRNRHLLDLITDANFANLVGEAFQKEGQVVRGQVTFGEKPYEARVLRLSDSQSQSVKTLIVLRHISQ